MLSSKILPYAGGLLSSLWTNQELLKLGPIKVCTSDLTAVTLIGGAVASELAPTVTEEGSELIRGLEWGKWKHRGIDKEGWHFHLGSRASGLGKHHLPQESINWLKNALNLIKKKMW